MTIFFSEAKLINILNKSAKSRFLESEILKLLFEPLHTTLKFLRWPHVSNHPQANKMNHCETVGISHRRPKFQRPKGIWKNLFAAPFNPSKKRLSKRSAQTKKKIAKRAGLDATFSQLIHYFRMGNFYLIGEIKDQINLILFVAAYNLYQCIRLKLDSFFALFFKNLSFCVSVPLKFNNSYLRLILCI